MLTLLRLFTRLLEAAVNLPVRVLRALTIGIAFNPRLGPVRHVFTAAMAFVVFAVLLVYIVAPIRGYVGAAYQSEKIRYDAERWLATAIYDSNANFAGTFDPRLDSKRDVNFTGRAIEVGGYTANPDHKSIPVQSVPDSYWQCLKYHEDRRLGGLLNPFGIDLVGVLKMPYSSLARSVRRGKPSLGVGGSTLPMQLVRVIYKTPPSIEESPWEKLGRKFHEWWMAPVLYRELTRDGDDTPLKQWAANHLWLAQRTGGAPLHGVEVTSRIVFGKEAKDLTAAEQYVLASAVNKPIILLDGSDRLNQVRLDRWRYIVEVRARQCAQVLIADVQEQKSAMFELVGMAGGPPDPLLKPRLEEALERYAPSYARRAKANPRIRANVLMPAVRLGLREEMKHAFGFDWRKHVRGITATVDVSENLALRQTIEAELAKLDQKWSGQIGPDFTLDPAKASTASGKEMPNVIVVSANAEGEIIRYYENSELAPYFGSVMARDAQTGHYMPSLEARQIGSTGKMLAAIGIANQLRDNLGTLYIDAKAPEIGLETCRRNGTLRIGRPAEVAFACSLTTPLEWRTAQVGQTAMRLLIDEFGFNMPPAPSAELETPASTAAVRGLVAGSPRQVHHMAGMILASLTGRGGTPQRLPTLVSSFDFTNPRDAETYALQPRGELRPDHLIRPAAHNLLRALLEAPLCYEDKRGNRIGTLNAIGDWCAARRASVKLHIAKTGTTVTADPDATVDTWAAGGIQFASGAAYSYVVLVGTGDVGRPLGRRLHASQLAAPLLRVLLEDLENHAKRHPIVAETPRRPSAKNRQHVAEARGKRRPFSIQDLIERNLFSGQ
jgi:penicillin-binding protein 1A